MFYLKKYSINFLVFCYYLFNEIVVNTLTISILLIIDRHKFFRENVFCTLD
jgi:hypothetical protein